MKTARFYFLTLILILIVLGYLTYQILQPFFVAVAWAAVLTIVFYPVYKFTLRFVRSKFFASSLTVILILLIIIGPFFSLSLVLLSELKDFAEKLDSDTLDSIKGILSSPRIIYLTERAQSLFNIENISAPDIVVENLKKIGNVLLKNLSRWISNITNVVVDFIFMSFAIFFLLKDGPDFLGRIKDYLPFSDIQKERLASQIKDMVISTVYGGVTVAVLQGLLGGMALYILGIKSPVLWGTSMAIMSFLPMFGTFVIWGPVGGYLIIQGSYIKGIGLLLFGFFVIGMVDNILKPLIISGRTRMPTLLIFFGVLGGINFFGFIGFIMGPLVLALFISVFTIFRNIEGGSSA